MNKKYVIGVDGGNTKTDYLLYDTLGNYVDGIRSGTCSHEGLKDSFEGSYRVMKEVFDMFLSRNNLVPSDIKASVFGLAGVDTPYQKMRIEEVVSRLGFSNFKVVNDSFLGIKAMSQYGVCSICGTGTSSGGIDLDGNYLQVGGIGAIVGDEAGGRWLARRAIKHTFDSMYRFGKKSLLDEIVMNELEVTDKYYLMESISERLGSGKVNLDKLSKAVFECANLNDEAAIDILKEMANNLARSAGGCVVNLNLGEHPLVILAGSVWVKGSNPTLVNEFKKLINEYTKMECDVRVLTLPPATGAIVWAYELYTGTFPTDEERLSIVNKISDKLSNL